METILLIDDDREIRRGLRFALQELGYFVVEAEGSEAVIQSTSDFSLKIDLLLTDAECAKESGVELAAWIQQIQPDMGVLCMTTSVEQQLAEDRALPSRGWCFIEKPFQFTYLAQKVREVLDANVPNARHFIDELKPIDPGHPYQAQCGIRKETAQHFGAGCYAGPGPMRGRVVIPIRDGLGELLAYANWAIDRRSMKHVFLPQFDPSRVLFNLKSSFWPAIQSGPMAIVVGGFLDCMKVHQAGFPCVVSIMDSLISEVQAQLLSEHFYFAALLFEGRESDQILRRLATKMFAKTIQLPVGRLLNEMSSEEIGRLINRAL